MSVKVLQKFLIITLCTLALIVLCAPTPTESRRVIFHAPRKMQVLTGQILSTRHSEKPCQPCYMRDHRGHCRRIISYNADGVKC